MRFTMESWLTEALEGAGSALDAAGDQLTLLADPGQLQLDLSVPLQLLYDQVTAYRCRLCPRLLASLADITEHIETSHCQPDDDLLLRQPLLPGEAMLGLDPDVDVLGVEEQLPPEQTRPELATGRPESPDIQQTAAVSTVPDDKPGQAVEQEHQGSGVAGTETPLPDTATPLPAGGHDSPASDTPTPVTLDSPAPVTLDTPISDADRQVYLCGDCGHVSETVHQCNLHLRQAHSAGDQPPDTRADSAAEDDPTPEPASTPATHKKARERRPPHKLRHDKRFPCRIDGCPHRFTCEPHRNMHERCHVDARTFKCSECGEASLNSWIRVKTHLWRQHAVDVDLFSCDKCEFKTAFLGNLENHQRLHVDTRSFVCPTCGKGFKQPAQLLNHRVIHADQTKLPVPKWFEPQMCKLCSKMFSSRKSLKTHQRILHDKIRKFCCRVCSHTSATKALLELHMRGHSGEMPFVCPEESCDYRTRDPSTFRRHKMRHSGVRPYKCPHCSYTAIQSSAIKYHVNAKHGGAGLYRCHLCTFCTVNRTTFAMHRSDHERGVIAASEPAAEVQLTALVARSGPNAASHISDVLGGGDGDAPLQRHEYVFTIAPDAPAEDRGGICIPAGQEHCHLVSGIIGGATVATLNTIGQPVQLSL